MTRSGHCLKYRKLVLILLVFRCDDGNKLCLNKKSPCPLEIYIEIFPDTYDMFWICFKKNVEPE